METTGSLLEQMLKDCGGFGRYQLFLVLFVLSSKLSCCWSMMMMTLAGASQDWWCQWHDGLNVTKTSKETCSPPANSSADECETYIMEKNISTVITEWNLICDKEWVGSTMTTIQMSGLLISGLACGHLADALGRKPTFLLSVVLLLICNIVAAFSVSWQMFATLRFFSGLASGMYLAVLTVFLVEFVPQKGRGAITALPSWNLWVVIFSGLGMWLHDWSKLHLAAGIVAAPFLIGWWYLPESFRWLVLRSKVDEACSTMTKIAKINGKAPPEVDKINEIVDGILRGGKIKHFTFIDLFNNWKYFWQTVLLSTCCFISHSTFFWFLLVETRILLQMYPGRDKRHIWVWKTNMLNASSVEHRLSCAYGYYAISFGVEKLYGNIYVNLMLLNIVEIPTSLLQWHWINRFGRRKTSFVLCVIGGIGGSVVGSLQITDIEYKDILITVFAIITKCGVSTAWESMMIWSSELYPTVIRNIGFGFVNTVSRVGAMVAPQVVYLDRKLNGLMYFLCGGLMILAAICTLFLPETNNKALDDTVQNVTINVSTPGSINTVSEKCDRVKSKT